LHQFDDVEIGDINSLMLGGIEVLSGAKDALIEQIAVDLLTALLWNQHD
jgi:hypothetical protein